MTPKVSVLMPAYNAEKYIWEAIQSILDHQTYSDFEFIIIDDCSTDNTWDIIQNYADKDDRILAIKNEKNLKICKTLNKGIMIAQGEYIARMDADDISMSDRFEKQVKFLDEHDDIGIVGGTMDIMDEQGKVYSKRQYNLTDKEIRKHIFRYSPFCHPAVMIRKTTLEKAGYYNEYGIYSEDYDLYFRIWMYSKFANLSDTIIKYRILSTGMTGSKMRYMEECTQYIKLKAIFEYGYKMSLYDKIYSLVQYISSFIVTGKFRVRLFNFIRNS